MLHTYNLNAPDYCTEESFQVPSGTSLSRPGQRYDILCNKLNTFICDDIMVAESFLSGFSFNDRAIADINSSHTGGSIVNRKVPALSGALAHSGSTRLLRSVILYLVHDFAISQLIHASKQTKTINKNVPKHGGFSVPFPFLTQKNKHKHTEKKTPPNKPANPSSSCPSYDQVHPQPAPWPPPPPLPPP